MSTLSIKYAEIVFPIALQKAYTYKIPERFLEDIELGVRVLCPFGRRKTTGFVVNLLETTDVPRLKEIEDVLDPVPLFTPHVLHLTKWISEYYICGWGEALKAALPSGIHIDSERVIRLTHPKPDELAEFIGMRAPRQAEIILRLAAEESVKVSKLQKAMGKNIYAPLKALRQKGYVRMELELPRARVQTKYEKIVILSPDFSHHQIGQAIHDMQTSAPQQAGILQTLLAMDTPELSRADLFQITGAGPSSIKSLVAKGFINEEQREIFRDYYGDLHVASPKKVVLNADQVAALQSINEAQDADAFKSMLLYGVTGSGKTQVYIEAMHHALSRGKTAIVLVPEIALTPQTVRRFRAHFHKQVAVFHSRMSPGERYDSWRRTWEGKHKIVIGPRSALFAPLKNIGLIIVDEEHEHSYKQSDVTPRYHGRDVAVMRAHLEKAVIVLGSATPSVESFYNAQTKKYDLIPMRNRIDDIPMPDVQLVDMRREPKIIGRKEPIIFSRTLRQKMDEKLAKGEQIILLLNRRGFATLFKCQDCGYTAECPNCDISLTFHLKGHLLKCHYCGFTRRAQETCPECRSRDIYFRGMGTQRVEEELHTLFPDVNALRMDMDTTKGKRGHEQLLSRFGSGDYQILLGTQMVAKGLDFPNVTLVGVINADTELYFPDFRAAERTFQLLTQVAGRAGRKDKHGEVIIQTFSPEEYALTYAKKHDYGNFFKSELFQRRELYYPPYSRVINILFKGEVEAQVETAATSFAKYIYTSGKIRMLGPTPAQMSKIQNFYRWQILMLSDKSDDPGGRKLNDVVRNAQEKYKEHTKRTKVRISIDVDPVSIL